MGENEKQVTTTNGRQVAQWCSGVWNPDNQTVTIYSREGTKTAHTGDWITDIIPGHGGAYVVTTDTQHRQQ